MINYSFIVKTYLFSKFITFFFDIHSKIFLLKYKRRIYSLRIASSFFLKINNSIGLYQFLFLNYQFFLTFIKIIIK